MTPRLLSSLSSLAFALALIAVSAAAYPPSPVIKGIRFRDETARTEAPGSDIWPLTWAADGHQYTTFGDGGGFGGTGSDGRVSLGIARVEGGKDDYRGINIAGGKNAPHPSPFMGKSEGILAIGDTLYLWRNGTGSDNKAFEFLGLYRSDDHGATWRETGVEFRHGPYGDFKAGDGGFFGMVFCQFGRGYAGARDGFVYMYASAIIDPSHWNVQKPGRIFLIRVEKDKLGRKDAYRYFAGRTAQGQPKWTADLAARAPVWEDPLGTHRIATSYNAPLRRYLLSTMTVDRLGHVAIFDAPEPWGPWTEVLREQNTERWGSKVICFTFANKWLSEDGRRFVIVHTKDDSWASIEGEFIVAEPPVPPSPVFAGIEWAPAETIRRAARDGDNWPVTWADDDALYATWGDGTGFDPKVDQKLSCGFARITGGPEDFKGENIRSDAEQLGQGRAGKKGWGILCVDGVLYLWFGHADNKGAGMQLAWSRDHARTWTFADWKFAEFGMIGFINYGKNYEGARDDYVYAYSHDNPNADTPADRFILMRAPKGELTQREAWEFFKGTDSGTVPSGMSARDSGTVPSGMSARDSGTVPSGMPARGLSPNPSPSGRPSPVWTRDIAQRGAVFTHKDACLRSAMTCNRALNRYFWWQHIPQPPGLTNDRGDTRFAGGFGVYEAPEPWGPWTTVYFTPQWDVGPGEHGDFPAKWMDGFTMHLVFSGEDSFSVRKAEVKLHKHVFFSHGFYQ